ncbi:MAG: Do family serine endopeptidase [Alphaproteobacteria bacterium]|nr:Do family serine endopeptidase [Alphaproteobacteria bacterium]MDP6813823.1 Do family serine endopeptidase [Alphaproteobacteria bacterium]
MRVVLVLAVAGLGLWAPAVAKQVPATRAQVELSYAPLVKRAAPAVVNIYTRRMVEQVIRSPLFNDPFFRRFFGDRFGLGAGRRRQRMQNSLGSGVVVTAEGLIVTNHHVIDGADEITVALADRREFEAELMLADERTDLAVLRIDTGGEKLPFLELRDSDELEVGDLVLAIGNPFNVGQTVTSGIVSALARTGIGVSDFQFFIQTDAAINPGNSGGALITMDGRLVGVNTAIYSRTGGSHGIGFAVPSNMVRAIMTSATAGLKHVKRPWLGAGTQAVTAEIAQSLGLDRPAGVMVRTLFPGGPAAKAGVRVGDVLLRLDGHPLNSANALNFRLGTRRLGGEAEITFWRDAETRTSTLQLAAAPETPPRQTTRLAGRQPLAGATVANLSPALAEELSIDTQMTGVIVLAVDRRGAARQIGMRDGDQVLRVNGVDTGDVARLVEVLAVPAREWQITIRRGGAVKTIRVSI